MFSDDTCYAVKILDDAYRNVNTKDVSNLYCDQDYDRKSGEKVPNSGEWQGAGWYRFMEPAGTKLVDYAPSTTGGDGSCSSG